MGMSEQAPEEFRRLPDEPGGEELVAYQLEDEQPYGGPGGGGGAIDGDGD